MPLAVQPVTPAVAAIAADLGIALQPGTVVNAQVLQMLEANLVRIAIGSLVLDATTMSPLQQGQKLQLAVGRTATAFTLTPVAADTVSLAGDATVASDEIPLAPAPTTDAAPEKPTLTPQETRAVSVAAQGAVTRQAGLSQLFANLSAAVEVRALPRDVAEAATQVLDLRQTTEDISGDDIKSALASSGLMLESAMAQPSPSAPPDLKSALLVLRQVLSTWLADTESASAVPNAAKAAAAAPTIAIEGEAVSEPVSGAPAAVPVVRATAAEAPATPETVAAAVQSLVAQAKNGSAASGSTNLLAMQLIASEARPAMQAPAQRAVPNPLPPPFRDGLPSPQQVASPSLAAAHEPLAMARQLMADTDGALARQTLLQVASLPDRIDQQTLHSEPAQPRWHFEIPLAIRQGTAMAQFEIARDGGGQDYDASQRQWRARFSLNLEPAGPVHALITFSGDATHVKMWAERPATAARLRADVGHLSASFDRADLKAGDIVVADGAPAQARAPSAGHFLNRAT